MGLQPEGRRGVDVGVGLGPALRVLQWGSSPKAGEEDVWRFNRGLAPLKLQWGSSPKAGEEPDHADGGGARRRVASMGLQPEGRRGGASRRR